MWNDFYKVPSKHSAESSVDPFDDYIEDTNTGQQEVEGNVPEEEQTPAGPEPRLEEDEPIPARTRSHHSEPIASRTRSQQGLMEMAGFANAKTGSNLNEWLMKLPL